MMTLYCVACNWRYLTAAGTTTEGGGTEGGHTAESSRPCFWRCRTSSWTLSITDCKRNPKFCLNFCWKCGDNGELPLKNDGSVFTFLQTAPEFARNLLGICSEFARNLLGISGIMRRSGDRLTCARSNSESVLESTRWFLHYKFRISNV